MTYDGFSNSALDQVHDAAMAEHMERNHISPLDAVKHFPVLARRQLLKRFLAHHELFLRTLDVPGDIVELGVYRGFGLMTWANLLECYCIGDRTKTVWGFDHWSGLPPIEAFRPAQFRQELLGAINLFDQDRFIPQKKRVQLIDGRIEQTVPAFVVENHGRRFSLIHFDCDLYVPTKAALDALWPKLSRGGVLIFDEYGIPEWSGETQAADEFLADKPDLRLQTFDWTNAPGAFLVKPY